MKNSMQKGFTLIELMIVIAIIGVLAAVAIPAYQDYIAKSQVTAGLAEIASGKVKAEMYLADGTSTTDIASLGLATSSRCTGVSTSIAAGGSTITCTLAGATSISGKIITLTRTADLAAGSQGTWSCATNAASKYNPKGCGG